MCCAVLCCAVLCLWTLCLWCGVCVCGFFFICTFSPSNGYFGVFVKKKVANGEKRDHMMEERKHRKAQKTISKGCFFFPHHLLPLFIKFHLFFMFCLLSFSSRGSKKKTLTVPRFDTMFTSTVH